VRWPLTSPDQKNSGRNFFAEVTHQTSLMGELLGRMEVAAAHEGFSLADPTWTKLPPKKAIAEFRKKAKKLMTRKQFDKLSDALRARSFTVAYLEHDYQLEQTSKVLKKAITKGTSRGAVVTELREKFAKWGVTETSKHHLETVHSTNILGAYQHGRWAQMSTPKMRKRRPFWQYATAGDRRVRPSHQAMDARVFPADSPVWDTWYPPNGFRCRCTVFPLSKSEAADMIVEDDEPKQVPDEGFATSPGAAIEPIKTKTEILP
jgi:SPP1 gp7 family putative phage head morphogenesis protein